MRRLLIPVAVLCGLFISFTMLSAGVQVQDDTVLVVNVGSLPIIDGIGNDDCWQDVPWQPIDQVWIPYGGSVDSTDYWGRYKVAWSSSANVLYFLSEVYDDVAVGGYIPGVTADNYNFDLVEVFIDEDHSGGLHVFDGTGATAIQYGTNAENAFAHHVYADFPEDGGVTTVCDVGDIAGTDFSHLRSVLNTQHFPEFALRKQGNLYTREFSLKVYNDTYDDSDIEASRVRLAAGKVMGLSVAVCENDDADENPKTRDNFFGSVWVPAEKYNNHWIDASDFGTAMLVDGTSSVRPKPQIHKTGFRCFPNPSGGLIHLSMQNQLMGDVSISVFDILGREVIQLDSAKPTERYSESLRLNALPRGMYFVAIDIQNQRFIQKVIMTGSVL